jgi:hypothetical protein
MVDFDPCAALHRRDQIAREAIREAVHDAACHIHHSKPQQLREAELCRLSYEMAEAARRMKAEGS